MCRKMIRATDRCIKCSLCTKLVHIKCLPSYNQDDIDYASNPANNWSCTMCLQETFPFFNLETNQELINCNNQNTNNMDPDKAKDLIFDPFETIMDENENDDPNDPDMNYYRSYNNSANISCKYYNVDEINKLNSKNNRDKKFTIFHLNIRSMAKNYRMFQNTLAIIDTKFDVIILSETWLKPYNVDIYKLDGYTHEFITRNNKAGGGLSIYIKDSIQYNILPDLNVNTPDIEMLWLELKKDNLYFDKNLIIGTDARVQILMISPNF
jgi:hypothetical protein